VTNDIGLLFILKTIGDVASESPHSHLLHCPFASDWTLRMQW
jgi:hypothetical protein